jgi:hypothetical protein
MQPKITASRMRHAAEVPLAGKEPGGADEILKDDDAQDCDCRRAHTLCIMYLIRTYHCYGIIGQLCI